MFDGKLDVHGRQDREDVCLQEGHEDLEAGHHEHGGTGQRGGGRQDGEFVEQNCRPEVGHAEQQVSGDHVAQESQRQRDGANNEVRQELDRRDQEVHRNGQPRREELGCEEAAHSLLADAPAALIDSEIDVLRRQAAQRFGGNEKQALELPRELFEEQAKRRVVVGLLLGEVIRTNELKADEERVKGLIEEMASAYEDPKEVIEFYSKNKELMDNMRNVALEEQAVEAVLAKAKVTEKETTFNELMNQQA